jgi:hypothetical protein
MNEALDGALCFDDFARVHNINHNNSYVSYNNHNHYNSFYSAADVGSVSHGATPAAGSELALLRLQSNGFSRVFRTTRFSMSTCAYSYSIWYGKAVQPTRGSWGNRNNFTRHEYNTTTG